MADRVERLTNLVALLLETPEPLSLIQIAGELHGQYPDALPARRAAFERDKAALREIGVPIDTSIVEGGEFAGQTRYRIDRSAYELEDLDLEPDEMRALQVAVAAVHTGTAAGQAAIWKLGGEVVGRTAAVSATLPERPELPMIRAAVADRSPIEFSYRDTPRCVEPWGVLLRHGKWYVIGHDRDRDAMRTFRVDRIDGAISAGARGAFSRPNDFDPRDAFPTDPKQIGQDEEIDALVRIDAVRAGWVEREVGPENVVERLGDGAIVVRVPAGNLVAFRDWVLGLLDHAVVLEPAAIRDHVVGWLDALSRA
jgi:proteasome accessory factor B